MKKLKILSFCCLFFGSLNAQMYDGSMFFRQYPTFEKMTSKGQDSVFHYFRMSMDGNCKIFEDSYLLKSSLGVLKSEFHTFFKEKLCASDLVILDAHWDNKIDELKKNVLYRIPFYRKKIDTLLNIQDKLMPNEVVKLKILHNRVAEKINAVQLSELKALYVKAFQNYRRYTNHGLNKIKKQSYDIDSSEYVYNKTVFSLNQKYILEHFNENLIMPVFLNDLDIKDYYFEFASVENKLIENLIENYLVDRFTLAKVEDEIVAEKITDQQKLSSLLFFIGENYPELKLEKEAEKLQYSPKVPFIASDLDIQKMVLKDSLTTLGFIVDREKQKYHLNFSRFIQNEIVQGNFSLMPSLEKKLDLVNQINEASRGEDYKFIQNNDEDLIYIFRFEEDRFEIQAFKIKNGEAVGLLMFIRTDDKPDIEIILKQYMSFIKL